MREAYLGNPWSFGQGFTVVDCAQVVMSYNKVVQSVTIIIALDRFIVYSVRHKLLQCPVNTGLMHDYVASTNLDGTSSLVTMS